MVQRKTLNYKPSFKASSSLEEVKKPSTNMKPSIQILDIKAKAADLAKKMKKSRSFKRSTDLDNLKKKSSLRKNHLSSDYQPPKQSPPKQSPPRASSASPNYMKSTSSSEARKEQKQVNTKTPSKSVIESISKRLFSSSSSSCPKSVSRTSSLDKVRTLTKAPSFKPSRTIKSVKKCSKTTSLCDVKRNTCSSTMKDSKFPNYLDLSPGGTESHGTSIMKVCPYNYCSLNGHRHSAPPPLKSFLCARRRMMKARRNLKPVASAPCKVKPCLDDDQGKEEVGVADKPIPILSKEEKADFFVEIYEKKDDQEKESDYNEMKVNEDAVLDECVFDVGSFDWESSDMEWEEEGKICFTGLEEENGDFTPSDQESDHTKGNEIEYLLNEGGLKKDDVNMEFLKEFLEEESVEFSQDEIIDCHGQLSDSDSSMNDVYEETELDQFFQGNCDDVLVPIAANEEEKILEESPVLDQAEEDTNLIQDMIISGFTNQASCNAEEEQDKDNIKKELLPIENINQTTQATEAEEESTTSIPDEHQSKAENKPNGNLNKNNFKKENTKGELSSTCISSLIITKGKRNRREESEELKSFNPREPNFLDVELDPEGEKVDLKHQEIDERKNSEEWMVDFALRKAVNNLAPSRKKKVAMLVAAFETVIPPSRNCEARVRPISSAFARVQACN